MSVATSDSLPYGREDPDSKTPYKAPSSLPSAAIQQSLPTSPQQLSSPPSESELRTLTQIRASASQNSALLVALQDTENATKALAQLRVHIAILKEELDTQDDELNEISRRVDELSRGRTSKVGEIKDLVRRVLGLLKKRGAPDKRTRDDEENDGDETNDEAPDQPKDEKKQKEAAYFAALAQKSRSDTRKSTLKAQLSTSSFEEKDLIPTADKHIQAHKDLDALYALIFTGPTPGFPLEDQHELAHNTARHSHDEATERVTSCKRAIRLLQQCVLTWKNCGVYLRHAKKLSEKSAILVFSDIRADLRMTEHYASIASVALEKAIGQMGLMESEGRSMVKDMHKIVRSVAELVDMPSTADRTVLISTIGLAETSWERGKEILDRLVEMARDMERTAREGVRDTARALEDARGALQQVRQEVFEEVAGFGVAPPAYNNCCDRSPMYEAECDAVVLEAEDEELVRAARPVETPQET